MKLAGCTSLTPAPLAGTWYRAIRPRFLATALHSAHTPTITSRFSSGTVANPQFELLYLTESPIVAMFEVGALLGSFHGSHVPNPFVLWTIVSVQVDLRRTADLTDGAERGRIRTSVQELTGDWASYRLRRPNPPSNPPSCSEAPTQRLGRALHDVPDLEGFVTYSAKVATLKNLIIFPKKVTSPSRGRCTDPTTGAVLAEFP